MACAVQYTPCRGVLQARAADPQRPSCVGVPRPWLLTHLEGGTPAVLALIGLNEIIEMRYVPVMGGAIGQESARVWTSRFAVGCGQLVTGCKGGRPRSRCRKSVGGSHQCPSTTPRRPCKCQPSSGITHTGAPAVHQQH